jgi:RNA methyltransferase, TrmH family
MISKTTIQYVKSLQDKKQRQKYDQFVVEGEKSITELLKSHFKTTDIFASEEWLSQNHILLKSINCSIVSDKELKQMSVHQAPQKVLALVDIPKEKRMIPDNQLLLALDEIQDPGNMGTIIRLADWYGIAHIICSKGSTDVYNPKCINSTMGSFLRVNVIYDDIIETSKRLNLPLIVAVLEGNNVHSTQLPQKGILVIGNEGRGVNSAIVEKSVLKLTIPRFGGAESLNAAMSTAILLDNFKRNFN